MAAAKGTRPAHQEHGLIHDAEAQAKAARVRALVAFHVLDGLLPGLLWRFAHNVSWCRAPCLSLPQQQVCKHSP